MLLLLAATLFGDSQNTGTFFETDQSRQITELCNFVSSHTSGNAAAIINETTGPAAYAPQGGTPVWVRYSLGTRVEDIIRRIKEGNKVKV